MGNRHAKPRVNKVDMEFREWLNNVTADEIRAMFLETLTDFRGGPLRAEITRTELQRFDRVVKKLQHGEDPDEELTDSAEFQRSTETPMQSLRNDQIQRNTILDYLIQAHSQPGRQEVVRAALPILESLVVAHVHFPFSAPTPLDKDALCRGLLILTNKCEIALENSESFGFIPVYGEHDHRKRLLFIGKPTHSDVIDIACRVHYPCHYYLVPKGEPVRRPLEDLIPLATRLEPDGERVKELNGKSVEELYDINSNGVTEPLEEKKTQETIPVPHTLRALVEAFPEKGLPPSMDFGFDSGDTMTAEELVTWGKKVKLLYTLRWVFIPFFRKKGVWRGGRLGIPGPFSPLQE